MSRLKPSTTKMNQSLTFKSPALETVDRNHKLVAQDAKDLMSKHYNFVQRLFTDKQVTSLVKEAKLNHFKSDLEFRQAVLEMGIEAKLEDVRANVNNYLRTNSAELELKYQRWASSKLDEFLHNIKERRSSMGTAIKVMYKELEEFDDVPAIKDRLEGSLFNLLDDFLVYFDTQRRDLLKIFAQSVD